MNLKLIAATLLIINIGMYVEWKSKKACRVLFYCSILLFLLCVTIRDISVPDTRPYINIFNKIDVTRSIKYNLSKNPTFEVGYMFLNQVIKMFTKNYRIFFCIVSILILGLTLSGGKKIVNSVLKKEKGFLPCTFLTLYIPYYGIYNNFVTLRNGLASALVIFSIGLWLENKKISSILFICISSTFHTVGLVGFVLLLILSFPKNFSNSFYIKWWAIIGILPIFDANFLVHQIISKIYYIILPHVKFVSKYLDYINDFSGVSKFSQTNILIYMLMALPVLQIRKAPEMKKILNICMVGLTCVPFLLGFPIMDRIYSLFLNFFVILFSIMQVKLLLNENGKIMNCTFTIFSLLLFIPAKNIVSLVY